MEGGTLTAPPPAKPRRSFSPLLLVILLALLGAGGWFFLSGESVQERLESLSAMAPSLSGTLSRMGKTATESATGQAAPSQDEKEQVATESPAESPPPQDLAAESDKEPEETAPETVTSETADETAPSATEAPQPEDDVIVFSAEPAPGAAEQPADAIEAGAEEQQSADATAPADANATAQEEPQAEQAVAEAVPAAGEEQPDAAAPEEVQQTEAAAPATAAFGVWVYRLGTDESDARLVEKLQATGFPQAQVKGRWPGHFNDQNIFYRFEDRKGLSELRAALGEGEYFDYYYNHERIGQSVKRIFRENEAVDFVLIIK